MMFVGDSLRSTTMLYGVVGAAFLIVTSADASDLFTKAPLATNAPPLGAVDGFNGKVDAFGGSYINRSYFGAKGAVAAPLQGLQGQYGVQVDGAVGSFDSRAFGAVGGHLFWRDPTRGLIGLYGAYSNWNSSIGTVGVGQVAGEGAWYLGQWTLEGIAGVEFGNSVTQTTGSLANGFLVQTIDVKTRFFDKLNVGYYLNDNLKLFAGHRYLGGKNALALGAEYAIPLNRGVMASLFVEGRVGESDFHGIWGGVRFYFGQRDKSLIQRHRQDDPVEWSPDELAAAAMALGNVLIPPAPPPPPACVPTELNNFCNPI